MRRGSPTRSIGRDRSGRDGSRDQLVDLESKTVDLQSLIIKVDRGIHGLQIQVHAAREEIERAERHRKVVADELEQIAVGDRRAEAKTRRGGGQ